MSAFEKISVSLERQVVTWLRKRAAKLDPSVSALLSEAAVKERQRAERIALAREVGMEVPTPEELHAELLAIMGFETDKLVIEDAVFEGADNDTRLKEPSSVASKPKAEQRKRA